MRRRSKWEALSTEAVHRESRNLDLLAPRSILALMAREDRKVAAAVRSEAPRIVRAASLLARVLGDNGRVFLAGAGTSGRLGVLESAECPPTFGTDPDRIVALMAGGRDAVFRSVEGAEDREREGKRVLRRLRLGPRDLVVGISASSVTPFVRGALELARERRAGTVLVTCGARARGLADVVIAPRTGPEVLAGSTRLKAGTATKLVLNQMTLLAMIQAKKVYGPFMVDVQPRSAKLRDRALRMVEKLGEVDRASAGELLRRASGEVKTAIVMGRLELSPGEARRRLEAKKGDLRAVLPPAGARERARPPRTPARRRGASPRPTARPSG